MNDPANFCDLSKPLGTLNQCVERYEGFLDEKILKHFYSPLPDPLEPFFGYFLTIQGGSFKVPIRMVVKLVASQHAGTVLSACKRPEVLTFEEIIDIRNTSVSQANISLFAVILR